MEDREGTWIAAGLLDPAAPEADRRRDLLAYLADNGVTVEQMVTSARGGNLSSALVDQAFQRGELSVADLAERSGASTASLVEAYRLLGLPVTDPADRRFDATEVRIGELLLAADQLLPDSMTQEVLRSVGSALAVIAESAVQAFVGSVEDELETGTPRDRAAATTASAALGLELGTLLAPLLRHHMWLATERQRAAMVEAVDRRQSTLAVGFVDLVGFTTATATMTPDDLLAFMQDFHRRTFDIVTGAGGRVVKHIGDEIMFSAVEPDRACHIALDLVAGFDAETSLPRGGLAHGVVLARHGDLYGPIVNLAARLTDVAVPGEVLAAAEVAERATGRGLGFEPAGRRQLKGFVDPVATVSVRRA